MPRDPLPKSETGGVGEYLERLDDLLSLTSNVTVVRWQTAAACPGAGAHASSMRLNTGRERTQRLRSLRHGVRAFSSIG
jgi:hypothetical protein